LWKKEIFNYFITLIYIICYYYSYEVIWSNKVIDSIIYIILKKIKKCLKKCFKFYNKYIYLIKKLKFENSKSITCQENHAVI